MFARHFRPRQFLGSVYGTEPFRDFCRQRHVPFEQTASPIPADAPGRWASALAGLSREQHARVELDLAKVNELSGPEAVAHLLAVAGPGQQPPEHVPSGAPVALWFLLHHPGLFHEVFLHEGSGESACWHAAAARSQITIEDLEERAGALRAELEKFFRQGDRARHCCVVEARRLSRAYCFTVQVADRLQYMQVFTDDGTPVAQRVRPALSVVLAYYPDTGTMLLGSPLRSRERSAELLGIAARAALGVRVTPDESLYHLDLLKGPFRPLPDAGDMESVRVKSLHLRYPARAGRRQVKLETLSSDGPAAIEQMLRDHVRRDALDQLRVSHAELQIRLRVEGGSRGYRVLLWPDRSNLGPAPLASRFRHCLGLWGLCRHGV